MFNPNCENLQVRVMADLPPDCDGGIFLPFEGVRWLLVEPGKDAGGVPDWIDMVDPLAWKAWGAEVIAAGEAVTVCDLARRFDVPAEVALWGFQQYAADALLGLAALAA